MRTFYDCICFFQLLTLDGRGIPCTSRKTGAYLFDCSYTPQRPGTHQVNVRYGGDHIMLSPFTVEVAPYKESRIRAFGPGLVGGVVNKPAVFVVETNGETGALGKFISISQ
ncbi:unnamed protein product [Trichobilharzia regenti]|nr:unnamed protein product [Trichobilharzia regenti]